MSDESKKPSRLWIWFLGAIGLLALSLLTWVNGLGASFDRNPNPISITPLILSPVVAIVGAVWVLVLVLRAFWKRERLEQ